MNYLLVVQDFIRIPTPRTSLHLDCRPRHLADCVARCKQQVGNTADQQVLQMEMTQTANRIHPLMAGAAISVILVSLLGTAALTGVLPNVRATATPALPFPAKAPVVAPPSAFAQHAAPPVVLAPQDHGEEAVHRTVVRHYPTRHAQPPSASQSYAQASTYPQQSPTTQSAYSQAPPAAPHSAPVTQYSPVGIGVGAVVGGLLGNQVGNGKGKALATIAGVLGGGYLGNEIAKRTP